MRPGAGGDFILVPAGDFWMGADDQNRPNRGPRHLVTLDAFEIDRFEVTNERYKAFIDAGGYANRAFWKPEGWQWVQKFHVSRPSRWGQAGWNDPLQPVVGVDWP